MISVPVAAKETISPNRDGSSWISMVVVDMVMVHSGIVEQRLLGD
jgi:hypothetical protein